MESKPLDESFLASLDLGPGSLVVDCGASVGDVTAAAAATGARVIAFEANPHAFAVLQERFRDCDSVASHHAAVFDSDGTARFFLHEDLTDDHSTLQTANGSSLLDFKANVDTDRAVEVDTVDLSRFILELGERISVLKIDIEGAEIGVLNRLLDTDAHERVDLILVETHEDKIPELREPTEALRKRIAEAGIEHIRLDWI